MTDVEYRTPLRHVPLLPGEDVQGLFSPRDGLVEAPTDSGPLLALTNLRLVLFLNGRRDSSRDTVVAPLDGLGAVRVSASERNIRVLLQGLTLMLVGIIAYLAIGTFFATGLLLPLVIGGGIVFIGVLLVLRYLFWEEEGKLTFQSGVRGPSGELDRGSNWDLEFPYRSSQAASDAYRLLDSYFRARQGQLFPTRPATPDVAPQPPDTRAPAEAQEAAPSSEAMSPGLTPEPEASREAPLAEAPAATGPQAEPLDKAEGGPSQP